MITREELVGTAPGAEAGVAIGDVGGGAGGEGVGLDEEVHVVTCVTKLVTIPALDTLVKATSLIDVEDRLRLDERT